jgi:hypothetical protein
MIIASVVPLLSHIFNGLVYWQTEECHDCQETGCKHSTVGAANIIHCAISWHNYMYIYNIIIRKYRLIYIGNCACAILQCTCTCRTNLPWWQGCIHVHALYIIRLFLVGDRIYYGVWKFFSMTIMGQSPHVVHLPCMEITWWPLATYYARLCAWAESTWSAVGGVDRRGQ